MQKVLELKNVSKIYSETKTIKKSLQPSFSTQKYSKLFIKE